MDGRNYARLMAHYNRWMNRKIYEGCATLSDDERKQDRGAFFGSIHRTLNHLLWADLLALSRTGVVEAPPKDVKAQIADDFDTLRDAREAADAALIAVVEQMNDEVMEAPQVHRSIAAGYERELPMWAMLVHVFNHQTHHRGQVTTLLSQAGVDIGSTDLHGLPGCTELAFGRAAAGD